MIKAYFSWQNFKQLGIRMRLDYKRRWTSLPLHFPLSFSLSPSPLQILKKDESTHVLFSLCSAEQQSDYFWQSFSVTWTCPSRLPLVFKSIEVLGFKYLKGHTKTSSSTEVLVCVSWTFKPDVRLVWSLTERGRESKTDRQGGREVDKSAQLWGGFQPCLFSPAQQQKGTVSIPLQPSLPGLQLIAALQRKGKLEGETDKWTDKKHCRAVTYRVWEQPHNWLKIVIPENINHHSLIWLGNKKLFEIKWEQSVGVVLQEMGVYSYQLFTMLHM